MGKGSRLRAQRAIIDKKSEQKQLFASKEEITLRSSPLPPVEEVEGYTKIYPDAAKVIFDSFKKEQDFRHKATIKTINFEIFSGYLGMILGFIVFLCTLGFGFYLSYLGNTAESIGTVLTTCLVFGGIYLKNRSQSNTKQLETKDNKKN